MISLKTTNNKQEKKGLVLGGGGSRGSYTMGVLKTLIAQNRSYDIVTGISIGALVGAVYTQQKVENLHEWISRFTTQSVVSNSLVFPNRHIKGKYTESTFNEFVQNFQKDGPSVDPLRKTFSEIFDYEAFRSSPIDYACIASNLTDNKPALFLKKDMTKDSILDCLCASAAYFPAFSFVEIDGKMYADGGYLNSCLGKEALGMGAQSLTVVALVDPEEPVNYEMAHTELLIRPILRLKYYLDFESEDLLPQIAQGEMEALKFMNLAPGYVYTFYKEDELLFRTLSDITAEVMKKMNLQFTNEALISGITTLLGYKPGPLYNSYMKKFQPGLVLECLGLITGMSCYKQYHVLPFIKELLHSLNDFKVHLDPETCSHLYAEMESAAIEDLLTFFHTALIDFDGKLPSSFDIIIEKFKSLYYLAIAWTILDKFSLAVSLF